MREQVKEDIIVEIEKTKTAEGIQIPAYIMFAVASKRP
jgi:hypothetical protein